MKATADLHPSHDWEKPGDASGRCRRCGAYANLGSGLMPCEPPKMKPVELTKREYFAGLALQGLCANAGAIATPPISAQVAVSMADSLLAELAKPPLDTGQPPSV